MDRTVVSVSKRYLKRIWDDKNNNIHLENLRNAKSRVDSRSPYRYAHLSSNAKKDRLLEERCTEIERENRILLEKMSQIIKKRSVSISKINRASVKVTSRRQPSLKIYRENLVLAKRLKNQNSAYKLTNFQESVKEHEELLNRISEYPYRLTRQKKNLKSNKLKTEEDKIVYMKTILVNTKKFDVELYKSKKKMVILAFDKNEVQKLAIPWHQALTLMDTGLDYDKILGNLQIENGSLVLVDNN